MWQPLTSYTPATNLSPVGGQREGLLTSLASSVGERNLDKIDVVGSIPTRGTNRCSSECLLLLKDTDGGAAIKPSERSSTSMILREIQ